MKKLLCAFLCLLMLACVLAGCAKDKADTNPTETATTAPTATPTADEASAEAEAVRIYMDNKEVWEIIQDKNATSWYGYLFLDLDFDGTLELIASTNGGTDTHSNNRFYKLDTENKTVTELNFPDKNQDEQWDFTGGDYPKVYRNNETQQLKYMVYDHIRGGDYSFGMRIGELTLDEQSNVVSKNLWGFKYTMAEASDSGTEENIFEVYDADGTLTNTDEDTYNNTLSTYEQNNTLLELNFRVVEGYASDYTFTELSEAEQQNLLLEGYKAFSYK
ncbi:MAG: hypothetical protein IJA62_03110 [Ruminococcus sp.]|nr:hypothetical protein [Ruminococcus sp.]